MKSQKIHQHYRDLVNEMVSDIRELLEEKGGKVEFDQPWEDESNNLVTAVSLEQGVHFDGMGEDEDVYPLEQLGIDDGIYILSQLEA